MGGGVEEVGVKGSLEESKKFSVLEEKGFLLMGDKEYRGDILFLFCFYYWGGWFEFEKGSLDFREGNGIRIGCIGVFYLGVRIIRFGDFRIIVGDFRRVEDGRVLGGRGG